MVNAKSLMLGITGFSYGYFMRCQIPNIVNLFNTSGRGVVFNSLDQGIENSWKKIMRYNNGNYDFPEGLKKLNPVLINIPVKNPTDGDYSSNYLNSDFNEEINGVFKEINNHIDCGPVIAAINSLNNYLDAGERCDVYSLIDKSIGEIIRKFDEFIIFSPYGDLKADKTYEPYGVYISSRSRPNPHETIGIGNIIDIFTNILYL
ncbi:MULTISPECIES: hypothetical protein [Acidiplasma]|uniref:Uncharacterized protein n=2 Tax=Acidiplasma TaxID=507753 RepID=A0A0N8VL98_9ARCH|nr:MULTISPECIES: hypothetical protein [Acidiplasma]KJE48680.1 hypothetical protein TZ01_08595 [Acidiplasma sp. MBA-1]KPV47335.1 hypothetical protein SE19_01505 [Acidiplasma aeolicum]KQB33440.1 hypothetical protein AOG54_07050 [Acidiplasma aeolicum]KQB35924.1 hypothetical protein AOG55_05370 [Acidiplasma cupricumulans]WMT55450.1 MAG: hypothetical protein RE470_02115 [Acidiplasma sp.]